MRMSIQTLNAISPSGLSRFPSETYDIGTDVTEPTAVLVRSADMHEMVLPDSVLAVARAGAGTNNIPIPQLTERGIVVFNTPGANANAVKELVIAGALLSARNLFPAALYVRDLEGADDEMAKAVEAGKKKYVGYELPGRTLGVIGLGAIGVEVANAALTLGMHVVGYDPQITIRHAWQLSRDVERAESIEEVFSRSDMVTLHVPFVDGTRDLVNTQRLALMKPGGLLLNFARGMVVDEQAVLGALDTGHLRGYVCDFPTRGIKNHPAVMALPHLGASTAEAEENCAAMAADQLRDFLEDGEIRNSVNLPEARLPRSEGTTRVLVINRNVPHVVSELSARLGNAGLNIADLLNKSRGDVAVTIADVDGAIPPEVAADLQTVEGVIRARII
ncbi:MAG: 3-phosphoglycerate dehydrogenase family protein [Dermatophilaceae bacterium]